MRRLIGGSVFLGLLAGLFIAAAPVSGAPNTTLGQSVAVCDPDQPLHCVAPWLDYANLATADTFVLKTGPGQLSSITINAKGTEASTVIVYDGLSAAGTKIATIDSLHFSGTFSYGVGFSTGLTIVTTGTVAPDVTVAFH